jgi:hypothetical protein
MKEAVKSAVLAEGATAVLVAQIGESRQDLSLHHLVVDSIDVGVEEEGAAIARCFQGGPKSKVVGGKGRVLSQDRLTVNSFRKGVSHSWLSAGALVLVKAVLVVGVGQLEMKGLEMNEQSSVARVRSRQMEEEGHEVGQQLGHIIGAMEAAARENLGMVRSGFDVVAHSRTVGNGRIVGVLVVDLGSG